jgi:diaminopimelate epimerase
MSARIPILSGAGNVFAVLDGIAGVGPSDPVALARAVCAPRAGGAKLDGLLILSRGREGGDVRMDVVNADGSDSETCGNGLRCIAKLALESGHVRGERFVIEDGAGLHPVEARVQDGRVVAARIGMGRPRILQRDEIVPRDELQGSAAPHRAHAAEEVRGTRVDVGNPHFVLVVADERTAPVAQLGPALETNRRFARGTNVEFLARRDGRFHLRVWERGVGETQACGSGACAAALVAVDRGLARWPVDLELPGGRLRVDLAPDGSVTLEGPVVQDGEIDAVVAARREGETR